MREDVVAAVLTLSLASVRISILNGQLLVKFLLTELTLRRLASLKVDYGGYFEAVVSL